MELGGVILALTLLLSMTLPVVFGVQKARGVPTREAGHFVGVGLGICFAVSATFVLGVTGISSRFYSDDTLRADRDCDRLGGEMQWFHDASGELASICVVGGD